MKNIHRGMLAIFCTSPIMNSSARQTNRSKIMFKTEYEANQAGFSCVAIAARKPVARKAQGVNLFKLAGYVLAVLAIVAAVY